VTVGLCLRSDHLWGSLSSSVPRNPPSTRVRSVCRCEHLNSIDFEHTKIHPRQRGTASSPISHPPVQYQSRNHRHFVDDATNTRDESKIFEFCAILRPVPIPTSSLLPPTRRASRQGLLHRRKVQRLSQVTRRASSIHKPSLAVDQQQIYSTPAVASHCIYCKQHSFPFRDLDT
jgi:hypothetical protein